MNDNDQSGEAVTYASTGTCLGASDTRRVLFDDDPTQAAARALLHPPEPTGWRAADLAEADDDEDEDDRSRRWWGL